MLKEIITWPNRSLRKEAKPVFKIDDDINQLVVNLIDTCKIMFGVGLAAPQIGVSNRVIVIKPGSFNAANSDPSEYDKEYIVMINPSIETSGDKITWKEACLSLPETDGKVERYLQADVTYMDLKGDTKKIAADWPFAGALQHEIDHLNGLLYIQRQGKKSRWRTLHNLKRARRKEMIHNRRVRRMNNVN